jgi:putative phosphoesterase
VIGVLSDTHGLLWPETVRALRGADLLIHAGDIGKPKIIEALSSIASLVAIKGNNDRGPWARNLPEAAIVKIDKVTIFVVHDIKDLTVDPAAAGYRVVISGHSHRPSVLRRNGVLFLNPGSAGPRRFKLPVALARLRIKGSSITTRITKLKV